MHSRAPGSSLLLLMTLFMHVKLTHAQSTIAIPVEDKPFLETYPELKKYVYQEPHSGFYLGFGVVPVGVLKDRTLFAANFFQLHHISQRWDFQILSASYGVTRAQSPAYQSNNFVFTSSLKYKMGSLFSFGPLIGYEFVNFPNLDAKLLKAPYETPYESFSSRGMIYGLVVSETFPYKNYLIQINQIAYQETYSNTVTPEGWKYYYNNPEVRANPALVAPSLVMLIEISFLF